MNNGQNNFHKRDNLPNKNSTNFNNNWKNNPPRAILERPSERQDSKSMACYKFARTGECEKGERCNYSHDSNLCKQEWRRQMDEAKKSPFADKVDTEKKIK